MSICKLGWHDWMAWSALQPVMGTVMQQRNCRRCGKVIVRDLFGSRRSRPGPSYGDSTPAQGVTEEKR